MKPEGPTEQNATVTSLAGAPLEGEVRSLVGTVIGGRYQVTSLLGSGGMGAVYCAYDREPDEAVPLKVLRPEIAAAPGSRERFRREVKLARRVTHTSVARTFELGEHEGTYFLTMEYVKGEPLSRLMARHPRLSIQRAAPILG